ncbi:MurR/RpiR family transcriptional regulator [Nonomuraea angiospora]|uniref:DNA-binding MurR/RpiR family transcriptional regulator n=1 Tax=Nonomuraea angiospora TaxID=46172 RepID=A0ABR9LRH5_9ACTN|nr:MurR/RpiR family transcriptional regulator [Nonomuraea angiospora]MBE1582865.1 DNA-binding MurR/RpiR family transcriptional regulator [Nonomuraea angiospora]
MENDPVADRLSAVYPELPPGERAIVRVLLDDYPFAALGSLRALAERAGVSPPTASRLFDRLGYGGFADFQAAVRDGARDRSRLLEFVSRAPDSPATSPELRQAAEDLRAGLDGTLAAATDPLLDAAAALLAEARTVWALGGPLSELAAEYLIRQLASLRPGAHRVPDSAQARARTVLDLKGADAVVAYDFRRYSAGTARFVKAARARGARLVLVTDAWESPLAAEAEVLIRLPREAAGPIAPLAHEIAVTELLLVAAAARLAPAERLADLDTLTQTL